MKKFVIGACALVLTACSSHQLSETKPDVVIPSLEQLMPALTKVTAPTEKRFEDGLVKVELTAAQVTHQQLQLWQSQLSKYLYLTVDLRWNKQNVESPSFKVTVDLTPETCRFAPEKQVTNAQCRQMKQALIAMVNPENYNNGLDLKYTNSTLEVGAVERLFNGKVKVEEEADQILQNGGGQGGN